ncbi:MAG: amidohydrolase family protein, partial [Anaerolineales bacterium]|nr:amidohydrolase family protein [Anaerolineales bacterium]
MYDLIIRNGLLYDGSGAPPVPGDVGISGDKIVAVGDLGAKKGQAEIDVAGLAVAPGFINMLSWATDALIHDGRSQSDIRQGVTLEVVGESYSYGPANEAFKAWLRDIQGDIKYEIEWDTLGEHLDYMERRGIACNIASFVGAAGIRTNVLGFDDVAPTPAQLAEMQALVREAMAEGAVGLSTALIYPPGSYAKTDELIALNQIVAEYGGLYISHLRSEGDGIEAGLAEFLTILRAANVRGEIYHLKMAGAANWDKLPDIVARIEAAQAEGLTVTADMYNYEAGGTGLSSVIPPWYHDGGEEALRERLRDHSLRPQIIREMNQHSDAWENLFLAVPSPEGILLSQFKNPALKHLTGKTLAEVAATRGTSPEETAMDLLIEDGSRVGTIYFMISEDNMRRQIQLPWVSFCSDSDSSAPEGIFLNSNSHPRAFGSFARLLGQYVRDEGLIPLEEAVRRLTSFPAHNLRIQERGWLKSGYFADVVVFDPAQVSAKATYAEP